MSANEQQRKSPRLEHIPRVRLAPQSREVFEQGLELQVMPGPGQRLRGRSRRFWYLKLAAGKVVGFKFGKRTLLSTQSVLQVMAEPLPPYVPGSNPTTQQLNAARLAKREDDSR